MSNVNSGMNERLSIYQRRINTNQQKRNRIQHGGENFSSPYNFIEMNEEVFPAYEKQEDIPDAGELTEEFISGEIAYEILAKTPILFEQGTCGITASAFRGLVRSNLQILGFTSLERDVEDATFKYRAIVNGTNKREYNAAMGTMLVREGNSAWGELSCRNIRAGIMRSDENGYYIVPTRAYNGKIMDGNVEK